MTISGRATVAGVFGWPVEHSLSPRLHGAQGRDAHHAIVPLPGWAVALDKARAAGVRHRPARTGLSSTYRAQAGKCVSGDYHDGTGATIRTPIRG